jgi:alginate O-acetyltransferase complex protein AlgI
MNTFFRDYIYIPLGGSRVSKGRWVFNTLVVWGITGLWHGAAWNFIVWGLYYALLLMLEKFLLGALLKKIPAFFSWCYMMFFTLIGFTFFMHDSNSIKEMFAYTLRLFGVGNGAVEGALTVRSLELEAYIPYIFVALIFCLPTRKWLGKALEALNNAKNRFVYGSTAVVTDVVYILAFVISIGYIIGGSYNPFIYFRF